MLRCLFPFISKRNSHLVLIHWQKWCLNIAGRGLWVLLPLLFLFAVENGVLPPFYNGSYLQLEQPILSGLHAATLITLGLEFPLTFGRGKDEGDGTCGKEVGSEQLIFCPLSSLSPLF